MRLLALIGCLASALGFSQEEHPILNYFDATLVNDQVLLSWEIKGGDQCNGTQINRSMDSLTYEEIGDIQGICGGTSFAQSYSFTDTNPVENSYNYYRLTLGTQGFSSVVRIRYIKLLDNGYKIYPNPVTDQSVLVFNNPSNASYTYEVFTLDGRKVFEQNNIETNQVSMAAAPLHQGIYVFRLSNSNNAVTGKFLVN